MAHVVTVTTTETIGELPEYIISAIRTLNRCEQRIEAIKLVRSYVRETYPDAVDGAGNHKFNLFAAKCEVEYLIGGADYA